MKSRQKISSLFSNKRFILTSSLLIPVILILLLTHFTDLVRASFGGWGDTSLVNACEDGRGRVTLVSPGTSCISGETQVTWLKDIDVTSGLSISRSSSGAMLSLDPSNMPVATERYEQGGAGISSPNGSWQDVPSAPITETFKAGKITATFNGSITLQNGDGTAYIRLKVQPTGGSASYVGDNTVFRSSSPTTSEYSNVPFTVQKVITVSAGEYTITPQVNINNASWGLYYQNSLIVEQ